MFSPISLTPMTNDYVDPLLAMSVKPFQQIFCGTPLDAMKQAGDGIGLHVILHNDDPVGLFLTDRNYHLAHTFVPSDAIGLRALIIDERRQGVGHGTVACQEMRTYLKEHFPLKTAAYATVHTRNTGGIKAMTRGGWRDTGTQHTRAATGPQHVFRYPLT